MGATTNLILWLEMSNSFEIAKKKSKWKKSMTAYIYNDAATLRKSWDLWRNLLRFFGGRDVRRGFARDF